MALVESFRAVRALLGAEESETAAIELIVRVPAARAAAFAWLATRLQNIHSKLLAIAEEEAKVQQQQSTQPTQQQNIQRTSSHSFHDPKRRRPAQAENPAPTQRETLLASLAKIKESIIRDIVPHQSVSTCVWALAQIGLLTETTSPTAQPPPAGVSTASTTSTTVGESGMEASMRAIANAIETHRAAPVVAMLLDVLTTALTAPALEPALLHHSFAALLESCGATPARTWLLVHVLQINPAVFLPHLHRVALAALAAAAVLPAWAPPVLSLLARTHPRALQASVGLLLTAYCTHCSLPFAWPTPSPTTVESTIPIDAAAARHVLAYCFFMLGTCAETMGALVPLVTVLTAPVVLPALVAFETQHRFSLFPHTRTMPWHADCLAPIATALVQGSHHVGAVLPVLVRVGEQPVLAAAAAVLVDLVLRQASPATTFPFPHSFSSSSASQVATLSAVASPHTVFLARVARSLPALLPTVLTHTASLTTHMLFPLAVASAQGNDDVLAAALPPCIEAFRSGDVLGPASSEPATPRTPVPPPALSRCAELALVFCDVSDTWPRPALPAVVSAVAASRSDTLLFELLQSPRAGQVAAQLWRHHLHALFSLPCGLLLLERALPLVQLRHEPPELLRAVCVAVVKRILLHQRARLETALSSTTTPDPDQPVAMETTSDVACLPAGWALGLSSHLAAAPQSPLPAMLFQALLDPDTQVLYGGAAAWKPVVANDLDVSLLEANRATGSDGVGFFHRGTIGEGKSTPVDHVLSPEYRAATALNASESMELAAACLRQPAAQRALAWQLGQTFAAPPGPPAHPRDLLARRVVCPRAVAVDVAVAAVRLAPDLMRALAHASPVVFGRCHDVVLSRVLAAAARWAAAANLQRGVARAPPPPGEPAATVTLWDLLRAARLLPHPLCEAGELLPLLPPAAVARVLAAACELLADCPPRPDQYAVENGTVQRRFPEAALAHNETLRLVLVSHIDMFGATYHRLFPPKA
eukprot:m.217206 g.217206  ORF g.217206 m.217206 type:complete len:991 (-) comp15598_c0_seq6:166-3138(-)